MLRNDTKAFYVFWNIFSTSADMFEEHLTKSGIFSLPLGASFTNMDWFYFQHELVITSTTNFKIKLLSIPKRQR